MKTERATIVLHSGDMDKVFSALIIANGALSMGMEASIYFTFFFMLGLPFVLEKPDFIWGSAPNIFCGFTAKIARFFLGGIPIVHIDDIWPEGPIDFGFLSSKFLRRFSDHSLDVIY